jgi:hypothetical protein
VMGCRFPSALRTSDEGLACEQSGGL